MKKNSRYNPFAPGNSSPYHILWFITMIVLFLVIGNRYKLASFIGYRWNDITITSIIGKEWELLILFAVPISCGILWARTSGLKDDVVALIPMVITFLSVPAVSIKRTPTLTGFQIHPDAFNVRIVALIAWAYYLTWLAHRLTPKPRRFTDTTPENPIASD